MAKMYAMTEFQGGGVAKNTLLKGSIQTVLANFQKESSKQKGFTLAEVLITLGIIGLVAAMTMPALIGSAKKRETVSKLQKSYNVLSQLVIRAQEDNGPVSFPSGKLSADVAETFFKLYWIPYFNSPTVVPDGQDFKTEDGRTGFIYKKLDGNVYDTAIRTAYSQGRITLTGLDGITYYIDIMKWEVIYDDDGNQVSQIAQYNTSQRVIVDINGPKNPNMFGKDVFTFVVNFDDSTVRPQGYNKTPSEIAANCSKNGTGLYCAAKIIADGWEIKDDYPW